jgi:hypothetical protein
MINHVKINIEYNVKDEIKMMENYQYPRMCESSIEIQKLKIKPDSKIFYKNQQTICNMIEIVETRTCTEVVVNYKENDILVTKYVNDIELTVLPTIEELLKMISTKMISKYVKYTTLDTSIDFNILLATQKWFDNLSKEGNEYANQIMTFKLEELLLAFIMYEEHELKWYGCSWIK